ncbi:hypothetical protein V8C35DRAFT_97301 [Trichoderma chlorosporum]
MQTIRFSGPNQKKEDESPGSRVLSFSSRYGSSEGPAYDVARYIPILAKKLKLSLKQLVEKRQMTMEDALLFLDTLWKKAEHIPCKPNLRNALHCVILLGAFGGWRPGSLINIKYRDVEFGWYSHPRYPNKVWPVVTIIIHHIKQRKIKIQRTQRADTCCMVWSCTPSGWICTFQESDFWRCLNPNPNRPFDNVK